MKDPERRVLCTSEVGQTIVAHGVSHKHGAWISRERVPNQYDVPDHTAGNIVAWDILTGQTLMESPCEWDDRNDYLLGATSAVYDPSRGTLYVAVGSLEVWQA